MEIELQPLVNLTSQNDLHSLELDESIRKVVEAAIGHLKGLRDRGPLVEKSEQEIDEIKPVLYTFVQCTHQNTDFKTLDKNDQINALMIHAFKYFECT